MTSPPAAAADRLSRDWIVAELARSQHDVVARRQLLSAGVSSATIDRSVQAGRLHQLHRGVYAVGSPHVSERGRWMAAVLAAGAGSALSHTSAARLWGIYDRTTPAIEVSSVLDRRSTGLQIHLVKEADEAHVTSRDGIPVMNVTRTICDLGVSLTAHRLARVVHEAAYRDLLDLPALRALVRARSGHRGVVVVRRAIELHLGGSAGSRSGLEDRVIAALDRPGRCAPECNVRFLVGHGRSIEPDFRWPEHMLCVEIDGPGHRRPQVRAEDRERDRLLAAAGYRVLRFTARQVRRNLSDVIASIDAALDAAEGR